VIGAIAGDVIGSVYEFRPIKRKDFPLFRTVISFTDDTVLTVAIADAILNETPYEDSLRRFAKLFPRAQYGPSFMRWLNSANTGPYKSFGNGSAMRVSPVGFAFDTESEVLEQAKATAEVTHNHPEGVKGAQATALAIFLARTGNDKETIRSRIAGEFEYDLGRTIDEIRPRYTFKISCQESVPEAIIAFLDSDSYEDAVRNAISLGGDSDTQACIAGGIAEAFYADGVPEHIQSKVEKLLAPELRSVTEAFCAKYR